MESWKFTTLKAYAPPAPPVPSLPIDWKLGARAFGNEVSCTKIPQAVVGLFGNAGLLLRAWAKERGAQILEPPPAGALLDGTAELWPQLQHPEDTAFIIPALERCFLRHYRGIRLARKLVESVWAQPCRIIIGCDAWAWKYLQQAVQIDALCPNTLTAVPLMTHPATPPDTTPDIAPRDKDFRTRAYVLHTLLVHDGVNASILPQLLPFRATQVLKTLADLREQHLAGEEDGVWRVAQEHYASIRRQLAAVEFWVSDT